MALDEQIVEEQVITDEQDPKPKLKDADRAKLDGIVQKMIANKESDANIKLVVEDFKKRYAPKPIKTEEFKVNIAQPTFKQQPVKKEQARQVDMQRDLKKPETALFSIGGQLKRIDVGVERTKSQSQQAQEKIKKELLENDDVLENTIRGERVAAEQRQQAESQLGQMQSDETAVQNPALQVDPRAPRPVDPRSLPVTPEDILNEKVKMAQDPLRARNILENIVKQKPERRDEIQAAIYHMDAANSLDDEDEESGRRVNKIEDNIKKLEKGELIYNWRNGQLIKPENAAQSFVTAWKAKNKAYDDYEKFRKIENNDAIAMELDARMQNADPDEAVPVPSGKLSEVTGMLGGTPAKVLAAGAIGSLASPAGGVAASAGVGALESYKLGWANSFERAYYELRRNGMDGFQAVEEARKLADSTAVSDAVVGGVSGLIGARIGMRSIPKGAITEGFKQSVLGSLKGMGKVISPAVKEGLLAGGVAGAGEKYKNELAIEAGLNVDADENVLKAAEDNLLMSLAFGALFGLGNKLSKTAQNRIKQGLSKMEDGVLNENLNRAVQDGVITEDQAVQAKSDIETFKKEDALIPENISEEARLKIADQIRRRDALESSMEALHKSFHPSIKEKIKVIDEKIAELSQEKAPKPDKTVTELKSFIDNELNEGVVKGFTAEVLRSADPDDLPGFMKDIADQANDPMSEPVTRETYGDAIVDRAIEMYPPKEPEATTVAGTEEVIQPTETINIEEDAIPQRISEEISVSEPPVNRGEVGEGIPQPEEFAGASAQEGQGTGQKEEIGITHADMDAVAKEFGFDTYEGDPETVAGWDFEAARRLREDPNALPDLFRRLRSGDEKIDHIDNRMMIQYMADLKAKINKNPTDDLLNQFKRAKDLFNIEGRAWGKAGRARQGTKPVEETLGDFLIQDLDDNRGVPLTEEEKSQTKEQFEGIQKAKENYKKSVDRLKDEKNKKAAEGEVAKVKKESKKDSKKDYKKERQDILAQMRADLLKVAKGEGGLMSSIPGAAQLKAIAPHVAKLVKNLVEQGIDELPGVLKAVHEQLKDIIPGIREKDIQDIIAGEYREQRKKRSDVSEKLFDLQTQAKLINQLENLERGIPPKSPKERQKRNAKIEKLKQDIKEHDVTKLSDYKRRVAKDIEKLQEELRNGDFDKEKPEPLELDKEAREAKDELLRLREEREVARMRKLYSDRNWMQKALDFGGKVLRTPKTIKASFDVSFLGRQTNVGTIKQLMELPFKKNAEGKWEYTGFEAQRNLRKQVADMYRSFASETNYRRVMADIFEDPLYQKMPDDIRKKLSLSDPDSPVSRFREEEHQTSLLDYLGNIPGLNIVTKGVKASNRAASAIANQMKWDIFKQFAEGFIQDGRTYKNSPEIYEQAAKYANQLVGRGYLGQKIEKANAVTAPIFWSLRLQASRLQLLTNFLNPMFYKNAPKEVRVAYLVDMAKFVATGTAILALANAAGAEVELDPRSSDFGSIKVGETRYDIWGGFKQYAVLFARMMSGQTKAGGNVKDLRDTFADELDSRQKSRGSVLGKFLQSKLTPEAGLGLSLLQGEDYMGKPLEADKIAWDLVTPLLYKDFTEAYKDGGLAKAIITLMASVHGIGANTYTKEDSQTKQKEPKRGSGRKTPKRTPRNK